MGQGGGRGGELSWALGVATLDRPDMLERCVAHALAQTRPPAEIVVADASDGWRAHRDRIAAVVSGAPVRLVYLGHPVRSSAGQRNAALRAMSADVAFLFDDDALMAPDCAAAIMALYEADRDGRVVAVAAVDVAEAGAARRARLAQALRRSALARWAAREVLLHARDRSFLRYDPPERRRAGAEAARAPVPPGTERCELLPGWGMTVRRPVALREPFDDGLLAYCPGEDLDASYRWGRHGTCLVARAARVEHLEVAASRLKRRRVAALALMNSAYLTRRNGGRPRRDAARFYVYALRRVLAELLKDLLMGRASLPQARGAAWALVRSPALFACPRRDLVAWYALCQRRILER